MNDLFYNDCVEMATALAGTDPVYFDEPLQVKSTPHTHPFRAWAVSASPASALFVMDADEAWHEVERDANSATLLLSSLYQRLRSLQHGYKKAS